MGAIGRIDPIVACSALSRIRMRTRRTTWRVVIDDDPPVRSLASSFKLTQSRAFTDRGAGADIGN